MTLPHTDDRKVISSLLFVPGARPDRFKGAVNTEADLICFDLEDSVPCDRKDYARSEVLRFLCGPGLDKTRLGIRINALDRPWYDEDLVQLGEYAGFVLVPKVTSAETIESVRRRVGPDCKLWPMIESPAGLRSAWEIAAASGVAGIVFGAFDYVAEVGCALEWEPLLYARSVLATACANAGVELMDAPSGNLYDPDELHSSTLRSKALGFTSRACVHPAQIQAVARAFEPTLEDVNFSRRVLEAFEVSKGGPASLDGRLIELPVFLSSKRLLSRLK